MRRCDRDLGYGNFPTGSESACAGSAVLSESRPEASVASVSSSQSSKRLRQLGQPRAFWPGSWNSGWSFVLPFFLSSAKQIGQRVGGHAVAHHGSRRFALCHSFAPALCSCENNAGQSMRLVACILVRHSTISLRFSRACEIRWHHCSRITNARNAECRAVGPALLRVSFAEPEFTATGRTGHPGRIGLPGCKSDCYRCLISESGNP